MKSFNLAASALFTLTLMIIFANPILAGLTESDRPARQEVPKEFQEQLAALLDAYQKMRDAFVRSNATQTKKTAKSVLARLGDIDESALPEELKTKWLDYKQSIDQKVSGIATSNMLEIQREAFAELTQPLYGAVKTFGTGGITVYYQYCPMAFDDKGAYWLSLKKAIMNPYFGDKMLNCGTTKETL